MASGVPSETAKIQEQANASSGNSSDNYIKNTNINAASGVSLSDQQKAIVGSILDVSSSPRNRTFVAVKAANAYASSSRATQH